MYRGKNQDYNITKEDHLTLLTGMAGEGYPPSVLKGSSLGILSTKKRGMAFFGV